MNKIVKRLVAVTMALFMVPGAMPSIAMAAPVAGTSDVTVETSTTAQIGSASSASAVTLDGEYTTAEVKADLRSIILLEKDKVVNVSKYGVSASDMDALVAEVLEENYVDGLIKVTCAVSKGMATYLVIERSEALVTAVDEMEAVTENAKASDEAESDAGASVAAASAYSISAYAAEDETEGGGQEGAETTSGLTDEQKQQLTSLYALYLKTHEDYPQYLGVMDPYFYTKNTDTSPLGGMLVVAGIPQMAIDAGMVSYDDLFGCIMTFYLGNMATVKFYGEDLIAAKNEALNFVKNSGAKTYVDKLMVLMDWLSNRASFNMPYIMNQSQKDAEGNYITMMKAPSGNEPVNKYLYSGDLEAYCKEVLTPIFEQGAMEDGRKEGKKVGYAAYIKENYKDAYDAVYAQMYQAVYDQVYEQAYSQMVEQGLSEDQAKEQADHVAKVEAEYAVAQQVAQSLDSRATATLNITIVDANGNTLGTAEALTKDGTKGETVTFTADEIKAAAEKVTLPEDYVLGEQSYKDVSVNGGETETISFVATEQAELTATLHVVVTDGDKELGRSDLTQKSKTAGTATFAAAEIKTTAAKIAGDGYDLDDAQFMDVTVAYDAEDTKTYTATAKSTESGDKGESGSEAGNTEETGSETGNGSEAQAQSEAPVTVENPAKEALTQNDAVAEAGDGTAALAEEETAEETTVDAAANAYAEQFAEGYAKEYAKNYAAQVAPMYAQGLAPQVVGSWNGNLVGALCLDSCVCKSYTYAYNYIIQWMNPDVYGKNGASTDLSNADNWKSPDDLFYESKEVQATGDDGEPLKDGDGNPITTSEKTFSTDAGYVVDSVRITYNKATTMFGEVPENFSSDHYWSAVKVDGEWYYIDSCYADIYIECMMRSRVETDGYINNLYFMISDASAREMYDGYFDSKDGLDTLYDSRNNSGLSDDTSYEHTWFSYAKSQVYSDGSGYYYMFDDTDALNELGKKGNSDSSAWEEEEEPTEYKLVYRPMASKNSEETGGDSYDIGADTSVQVLIDVNNGTFYNGETMEESALLKDLYSRFQEYTANYPGVYVSMAYADGIAYMSIGNTILAYDVKTHTLTRVLEYNKVYAQRDMDNAFGGMAFTVVDKDGENTLSVSNPPISAINIFDGKMTVSLATNYAFISGKKDSADADAPGYAFQETNYNASYVNYSDYGIDLGDYGGQLDGLIEQQENDNDEFMWAANFVDTIKLSDLTASEHSYEAVTVDPTCGIDGYTEKRCTTCGRIEDGTRKADEGTARDHHYIHFTETYYTKEDDKYNTGETFVCADCLHSVNYDDSDDADNTEWNALKNGEAASGHVYDYESTADAQVKLSDDRSTITVSGGKLVCPTCESNALDFLSGDENSGITADGVVEMTIDETLTLNATAGTPTGTCDEGMVTVYTANGSYKDHAFTVSVSVQDEPGIHGYEAAFQWTETKDDDGNVTDYPSAKVELKCASCGHTETLDATVTHEKVAATCTTKGGDVYTAEATDENGKKYSEKKTLNPVDALGHNYKAEFTWNETYTEATAKITCERGDVEENVKCNITKETKEPSYVNKGQNTYTATAKYDGKEFTDTKTEDIDAKVMEMPAVSKVTNVVGGVKVEWAAVEGATSYKVYRKDSEEAKWTDNVVAEVETTSYTDKTTESGKTYIYSVQAIATEGNKIASTDINENGKAIQYVAAPVVTKASNGNGKISVGWNAVEGAGQYRLYVKANNGGWKFAEDVNGTSTAFTGTNDVALTSGTTYTFTVRCLNEDGTKVISDYERSGASILYLSQPEMTQVSNEADGIKVTWKKVEGAKTYRLWVRSGNVGWTKVVDTTGTSSVFKGIDKLKLADGTTYKFTVSCIKDNGNNASSYDAGKSLLRLSNPKVTLQNDANGVIVKWGKINGAAGYDVYRKKGTGSWQKIAKINSGATVSYTDTAVKTNNNTEYSYTVRAINGSVQSQYTSKKIIRLTTPTISSAKNDKSKSITVKWNKNNSVTGYQVSYKTGDTEKTVTIKGKTTVSTTIKNLTKNKTYTVKVRSYRSLNGVNYYSGWSTAKNVKIKK